MASELLALAERVEKASGPDRELDADIAKAVGVPATLVIGHECLGNLRSVPQNAPRYTASLDAALTLVPKRWRTESIGENPQIAGRWTVWLRHRLDDPRHGVAVGDAATPALALCAAALRARAAQENGHER